MIEKPNRERIGGLRHPEMILPVLIMAWGIATVTFAALLR